MIFQRLFFLLLLLVLAFACRSNGPNEVPLTVVSITGDDVGVTEIWLRLKSSVAIGGPCTLYRNNSKIATFSVVPSDTVVLDDSLQPKTTYLYSLKVPGILGAVGKTSITTMDTSTHNYEWDVQTVGSFQSTLLDVWGSSSNDVWAVGFLVDTLPGFFPNAAHFDGSTWKLVQIGVGYQMDGIWGSGANDFTAVGVNGLVYHWDGSHWREAVCLGVGDGCTGLLNGTQLFSLWGADAGNLFCVGDSGVIVHYDGASWKRMVSGTNQTLFDVGGLSSSDLFCVGADYSGAKGVLLHYNGSGWHEISADSANEYRLLSAQAISKHCVVITGDYTYRFNEKSWSRISVPDLAILKQRIRGTAVNNIWIVGSYGLVLHWNGLTWHRYDELSFAGNLWGIWATSDQVFLLGDNGSTGVIFHGREQ